MKTFFTPARIWAPDTTYLHVYAHPDLDQNPDLAQLISDATGVLDDFAFIAPMDPQWRHMTVASTNVDGVHEQTAVEVIVAHLAQVSAFSILMGSAVATRSAVLLDSYDTDGGFAALEAAAVTGLKEATGDGVPGGGRAHMTLGYGIADGDSGAVSSKLREKCNPSHATWRVDEVLVVQVTQHPDVGEYRWIERARVALAG